MAFYIRKIAMGKWAKPIKCVDYIPADTITSDLRTSQNTLSLWRIENMSQIEDAFLALATTSKLTAIDKIDVAIIDEEELKAVGLNEYVDNIDGDTALIEMVKKHWNLSNVDHRKLGSIANIINRASLSTSGHMRRTKSSMDSSIIKAYKNGRIDITKLSPELADVIIEMAS